MNVLKIALYALILCAASSSFSQYPGIEWQNTIGGDSDDKISDIVETPDGGFLLGGYSDSDSSDDKSEDSFGGTDYWLVKIDALGNIEWDKTYGGGSNDYLKKIIPTSDNNFILCGDSYSDSSGFKTSNSFGDKDVWLLKINPSGDTLWQYTLGGSYSDVFNWAEVTSSNHLILGITSTSDSSGNKWEDGKGGADYWFVELDVMGDSILNQHTIGGSLNDQVSEIHQNADGTFIVCGISNSTISGDKTEHAEMNDLWIMKLDDNLEIIWEDTYKGNYNETDCSIVKNVDGGYVIAATSSSEFGIDKWEDRVGSYDIWLIKINEQGEDYWQNVLGGILIEENVKIRNTSDDRYIVGCSSESPLGYDKWESNYGFDYWFMKINQGLAIEWQETIHANSDDVFTCMIERSTGGYVIGGYSNSAANLDKDEGNLSSFWAGVDYWILGLHEDSTVSVEANSDLNFSIYPNPTKGVFTIDNKDVYTIEVIDMNGKQIEVNCSNQQNGRFELKRTPPGSYLINCFDQNGTLLKNGIPLIVH